MNWDYAEYCEYCEIARPERDSTEHQHMKTSPTEEESSCKEWGIEGAVAIEEAPLLEEELVAGDIVALQTVLEGY